MSNAITEITFACGHQEDRDLSAKPAGDRRSYASWLAKQKCTECWKRTSKREVSAEIKAEREAEMAAAEEDQEQSNLPILQGSPKQASWALQTRFNMLRGLYADFVEGGSLSEAEFDGEVLDLVRKIDRAKWWIDNREADNHELLEMLKDPGEAAFGTSNENPF